MSDPDRVDHDAMSKRNRPSELKGKISPQSWATNQETGYKEPHLLPLLLNPKCTPNIAGMLATLIVDPPSSSALPRGITSQDEGGVKGGARGRGGRRSSPSLSRLHFRVLDPDPC